MDYVSVREAARILGVSAPRVHQRIRAGSIPAQKLGNQWVIAVDDVRRLDRGVEPGRPLSAKSAWAMLLVAAGDDHAAALDPPSRSRARSRLRGLLAHAGSEGPRAWSVQVEKALRNRARRAEFIASPLDLPHLREDDRLHASGVSLPESGISAGDMVEGYVSAGNLEAISESHLLSPAVRSRANVVLHVLPDDQLAMDLARLVHSPLMLAADLAEHDGVREQAASVRAVSSLTARIGATVG